MTLIRTLRGHFHNDEAAMKLIWLQRREITKNWKMPRVAVKIRPSNIVSTLSGAEFSFVIPAPALEAPLATLYGHPRAGTASVSPL
jgi:hypothetical protein